MSEPTSMIRGTAIIEEGAQVGHGCFIGHNVVIRTGCVIGDGVVIGHNSVLEENVKVGDETRIQAMCYLTKHTWIGKRVFIGPCVATSNEKVISSFRDIPQNLEPAAIGYGARLGLGVVVLPGVHIGCNAMIGAGAVVTKDVPAEEMWFGVPATFHGKVDEKELI